MNATFVDRHTALSTIPHLDGTVILSISDTEEEVNEVLSLDTKNTSFLQVFKFSDDDGKGMNSMSKEDAGRIVHWIRYAMDMEYPIYVHCFAGVSRSAAVVKFIREFTTGEADHRISLYNSHVFSMLKQEAHPVSIPQRFDELASEVVTRQTSETPNRPGLFAPIGVRIIVNYYGENVTVIRDRVVAAKKDDQTYRRCDTGEDISGKLYWGYP